MDTIKQYYDRLTKFFKSQKGIRLSICLGLLGLLLILFSDFNKSTEDTIATNETTTNYSTDEYRLTLEENLTELIKSVDGAGDTKVMVTILGGERNVYAQEVKQHSNSDGSTEYENSYVTITSTDGKSALVSTVQSPEVLGVVVLCKGGYKSSVKEDIYSIVSALTGLSTSNIFVGQLS
jgi:stage III sporulation protein AG